MTLPTVSVIVSTYNRPGALRRTLQSLALSTFAPLEVIVGDDGSRPDTKAIVDEFAKHYPFPLRYVWQEDNGFRLAEIRNKTVAMARGQYIVQIDGDIVVDKNFVADHRLIARPGFFVRGTRVELSAEYTSLLENDPKIPLRLPGVWSRHVGGNRIKALRLGWPGRIYSPYYRRGATGMGANMAFWRDDFLKVNGYDENFAEWGCEDTDLMERFLRNGINSFKTFHVAQCYHLHHHEGVVKPKGNTFRILTENRQKRVLRASNGVDKWLNS